MAKNNELDAKDIEARVHDLAKSMERMKSRNADRDDVVVELKQSELSRLELLARDMQSVFDEVPDENDQFEFALTNGETPRLWIDMTSHVRMGASPRQYEFVKDTRIGRTILASSTDRTQIGQVITDYIADKMLERDRLIEGEWIAMGGYNFDGNVEEAVEAKEVAATGSRWKALLWFVLGAISSVGALIIWILNSQQLPTILQ